MPFTFTMPKLSPTMEEGTIAKWHKKEGEFVEAGELLLEIATDKATVEHNAIDPGWLRKILLKEGESAIVNQPVAILTEKKEEKIEGYQPEGTTPKTTTPAKSEEVPAKKENAVQTAPQVTIPQSRFVPEPPVEDYTFEFPVDGLETRLKASPLARKLAKEKGLDLASVKGSGPGGRIKSEDLEKAQKGGFIQRQAPQIAPGTYEEETLTPMRKTIGQRLQEAKMFIPHFYVTREIDATPLVQAREQLIKGDLKVSINDFVIRACALALREHPTINSGYHAVNNTVIRFKTIDISVGVSIEGGLITPIIRHADYKSLGEISAEMRSLALRARDGKLEPSEYKGGSFTISNMGMYGVLEFQAIINPPQAAILAVSSVLEKPVVKNGQVVPGKLMNVTLSADHRVIDGVSAAEFLKTLQKYLDNPSLILVH